MTRAETPDPCSARLWEQREVIRLEILKLQAKAEKAGLTERAEAYGVAAAICSLVKEHRL